MIVLFSFSTVAQQRNVILIIADDLGSDYCGFYENHQDTVKMPNIRKLLARGVRFRNAWSNPLCSPTRSGILTGRYSFRTGVGNAIGGPDSAELDTGEVTIPRLLNIYQPGGIAKAIIGKWHLQSATPKTNFQFPLKMGYDYFEGNFLGQITSFTNWTKVKDGDNVTVTKYATTETTDNAISWFKTQKGKPFFLWLAYNAPHTPHHLPPLGLHSYTNLSGTTADITANPKSYFKAAVEALDKEIGRLFDSLQVNNQWDNTDIIFIGDNGDDPSVAQNQGGAKGSMYQEGVNVPFIVSGPSVVNPGRASDALVNTHDLFATILELFGYQDWKTKIPTNKPVDSKSIIPIIKNHSTDIRDWVFTEVFKVPTVAGDGKAMRNKNYKLLDFDNGSQRYYNLSSDPLENTNLLTTNMSADALSNYNYLCTEMTNLVGKNTFCSISPTYDFEKRPISVYPNPFIDFIKFESKSDGDTYLMYNSLGKEVYKGISIEQQNFSTLTAGVYYLEIKGRKHSAVKLIKN